MKIGGWIALAFAVALLDNPVCAALLVIGRDFDQPIPATDDEPAWMDPVSLDVGIHLPIQDIDICLSASHTEIGDLQIFIDAPWNETVVLSAGWDPLWRDPQSNMQGTIFDDEASLPLCAGAPPYAGRFQSLEPLSKFDGRDAYGQWTLRIYDAIKADTGTLERWELHIETTSAPEPASLLCWLVMAVALMRFYPPRMTPLVRI